MFGFKREPTLELASAILISSVDKAVVIKGGETSPLLEILPHGVYLTANCFPANSPEQRRKINLTNSSKECIMLRVIFGAVVLTLTLSASAVLAEIQPKPTDAHTEWTKDPDTKSTTGANQVNIGEGLVVDVPTGWTIVGPSCTVHAWATHIKDKQKGSDFGEVTQTLVGAGMNKWTGNINTGLATGTEVHVILVIEIKKPDGKTIKISTVPKKTKVS